MVCYKIIELTISTECRTWLFFRLNVVLDGKSHRPKVVCDQKSYRRNDFRRNVVLPGTTARRDLTAAFSDTASYGDYAGDGTRGHCTTVYRKNKKIVQKNELKIVTFTTI